MAFTFTYIDGQRVEWSTAQAFLRMRADFRKAFPGIDLRISRGSVTTPEQTTVFLQRYVTAGNVRGRYVYDTRWWDGRLWYRVSSAGTVAVPRTSNHEIEGPNGPRSIDIRDTGADAGVTVRGSVRDRWMQNNAGEYDFENEGYNFKESWHKTFRGVIGGKPSGGNSTPGKGKTVTFYHREDKTARSGGRTLRPRDGFYLHTSKGMPTSNASNVVGGDGNYAITAHIYAQGEPGDVVTAKLIWQNTKDSNPKTKNSSHYLERIVLDERGYARRSVTFQRPVPRGFAVYLYLDAEATNEAPVKVTMLDSDALLID